jgi:hypothetical protein
MLVPWNKGGSQYNSEQRWQIPHPTQEPSYPLNQTANRDGSIPKNWIGSISSHHVPERNTRLIN